MSPQPYKTPPVTEAVIEIRFASSLEDSAVKSASIKFSPTYPHEQILRNMNVAVGLPPNASGQPTAQIGQEIGYRRSSDDLAEIVVLWPQAFVISQLAPYPGWDEFFERVVRDWQNWKKATEFRKIVRVGVRYINRIDIPLAVDAVVN